MIGSLLTATDADAGADDIAKLNMAKRARVKMECLMVVVFKVSDCFINDTTFWELPI
jgi:hypothetical protein